MARTRETGRVQERERGRMATRLCLRLGISLARERDELFVDNGPPDSAKELRGARHVHEPLCDLRVGKTHPAHTRNASVSRDERRSSS